ncbi:hypothetical protein [Bdellovibrio sp. HCB288]|uniref:hypothetical protein n=1 Tax=Bdellovibrio sp. HCB288 TaxID=3394355 RepID=UPI0039B5831A
MELQKEFVSELRSRELKFSDFLSSVEQMNIASCRLDLAEGRLVFSAHDGVVCSEDVEFDADISAKFDDGGIAQTIMSNQTLGLGLRDFVNKVMECGVSSFTIYPRGRKIIYFGLNGDCYYEFIRSAPSGARHQESGTSRVLQ